MNRENEAALALLEGQEARISRAVAAFDNHLRRSARHQERAVGQLVDLSEMVDDLELTDAPPPPDPTPADDAVDPDREAMFGLVCELTDLAQDLGGERDAIIASLDKEREKMRVEVAAAHDRADRLSALAGGLADLQVSRLASTGAALDDLTDDLTVMAEMCTVLDDQVQAYPTDVPDELPRAAELLEGLVAAWRAVNGTQSDTTTELRAARDKCSALEVVLEGLVNGSARRVDTVLGGLVEVGPDLVAIDDGLDAITDEVALAQTVAPDESTSAALHATVGDLVGATGAALTGAAADRDVKVADAAGRANRAITLAETVLNSASARVDAVCSGLADVPVELEAVEVTTDAVAADLRDLDVALDGIDGWEGLPSIVDDLLPALTRLHQQCTVLRQCVATVHDEGGVVSMVGAFMDQCRAVQEEAVEAADAIEGRLDDVFGVVRHMGRLIDDLPHDPTLTQPDITTDAADEVRGMLRSARDDAVRADVAWETRDAALHRVGQEFAVTDEGRAAAETAFGAVAAGVDELTSDALLDLLDGMTAELHADDATARGLRDMMGELARAAAKEVARLQSELEHKTDMIGILETGAEQQESAIKALEADLQEALETAADRVAEMAELGRETRGRAAEDLASLKTTAESAAVGLSAVDGAVASLDVDDVRGAILELRDAIDDAAEDGGKDFAELADVYNDLKDEVGGLVDRATGAERRLGDVEKELKEAEARLSAAQTAHEESVAGYQARLDEMAADAADTADARADWASRLEVAEVRAEAADTAREQAETAVHTLRVDLDEARGEAAQAKAEVEALRVDLEAARDLRAMDGDERARVNLRQLDSLREGVASAKGTLTTFGQKFDVLQAQVGGTGRALDDIKGEYQADMAGVRVLMAGVTDRLRAVEDVGPVVVKDQTAVAEVAALQSAIGEKDSRISDLKRELATVQEDLTVTRSKLETVERAQADKGQADRDRVADNLTRMRSVANLSMAASTVAAGANPQTRPAARRSLRELSKFRRAGSVTSASRLSDAG